MLAEIEIFINDNYTVELRESIVKLFNILEIVMVDDYQADYVSILMESNSVDDSQAVDRFIAKVFDNTIYLLKNHGISVNPEQSLDDLLSVLQGVLDVENYNDKDAIVRQIESTQDAVEALGAALELTTDLDPTKVYSIVSEVEPSLITNILELCHEEVDGDDASQDSINIVHRLKKLRDYLEYPDAAGFKLINDGLPIGTTFSNYLRYSSPALSGKDIQTIAKELCVLLYMSGDATNNPIEFYRNNNSQIFEDIEMITKVDIELVRIVNGFLSVYNTQTNVGKQNAQA